MKLVDNMVLVIVLLTWKPTVDNFWRTKTSLEKNLILFLIFSGCFLPFQSEILRIIDLTRHFWSTLRENVTLNFSSGFKNVFNLKDQALFKLILHETFRVQKMFLVWFKWWLRWENKQCFFFVAIKSSFLFVLNIHK